MDAAYPSMIAHYLYKLGLIHGHAKIQYTLLSMVSDPLAVDIWEIMADRAESTWRNLRDYAAVHQVCFDVWCECYLHEYAEQPADGNRLKEPTSKARCR